jgi:hypothetical protein
MKRSIFEEEDVRGGVMLLSLLLKEIERGQVPERRNQTLVTSSRCATLASNKPGVDVWYPESYGRVGSTI